MDGATQWRIPNLGRLDLAPQLVAEHVSTTGGDPKQLLDFLRYHLIDDHIAGDEPTPRAREFLNGYLQAATRRDGFIEIVGRPECGGLLLQGWAFNLAQGEAAAGVLGNDLQMTSCVVATFERADLVAPARGFVAYLKDATIPVDGVRHAFLGSGPQLIRLDTVSENRLLLEGLDVVDISGMLPRLLSDRQTIRRLQRVCRPRYPGHETITALAIPVRAAVDAALLADGAGLFLTGWLLDPETRVERVFVKCGGDLYHRLDLTWVRQPRPDLLRGFAGIRHSPAFGCYRADLMHGFLAFVPCSQSLQKPDELYLELLLEDGRCGFLPLPIEHARGQRQVSRILATISPDEPELARIVRDHLAPYVEAVGALPKPRLGAGRSIPLGSEVRDPVVSTIIPLSDDWLAIETLLSHLAADPDFAGVELVLVAGRDRARAISERLSRTMRFYGLCGHLVLSSEDLDLSDAFVLGASRAKGHLLLCVATSVLPKGRDWLLGLVAEQRASAAGMVCPTLLYEDGSIRYAGRPLGQSTAGELAGYPASSLAGSRPCTVDHGPPDCFLVECALLLELGGMVAGLLGPELQHLDLARRIQAAGRDCRWAPRILALGSR